MNWCRNFLWVLAFTSLEVLGQITPGTISISGNQTICPETVHGTLTVTPASGCTGGCSYQWMSSSDGTNFSNITSANGLSYTNGANISANIYYKVSISDGVNPTVETSAFLVSLHELPTVTISATPGLTIPSGAYCFTFCIALKCSGQLHLYIRLVKQCHGEPHDGHAYGYDQLHGHGDGSVHVFGNVYGGDGNGRSFGGRSDCHDGCHDLFQVLCLRH